MNNEVSVILLTFVLLLTVVGVTAGIVNESWKQDLIKRGVAQYNQTNGQWEYKPQFNNK